MTSQPQNGSTQPYNYRTSRSAELRKRNRRVGVVVALVAIALIIFTIIYVTWVGGSNMGPQAPLHSGLVGAPGHIAAFGEQA